MLVRIPRGKRVRCRHGVLMPSALVHLHLPLYLPLPLLLLWLRAVLQAEARRLSFRLAVQVAVVLLFASKRLMPPLLLLLVSDPPPLPPHSCAL